MEMKKTLIFLYIFLISLYIPAVSFAQDNSPVSVPGQSSGVAEKMMIAPPILYPPEASLPFGQNHYYTVTLRGNGQAVFALKTVFSNKEEASMSAVKFTFPDEPQNLSVYQAYREPQCISYQMIQVPDLGSNLKMPNYPLDSSPCQQYEEPNYLYGWGNTTYYKAKFVLNGRDLTVELPKTIKPNGSGSLLLSFLMSNVTNKDFLGAYNFSVDTVKVADTIQNLQVGIMVDPDYYLKDAKGNINYQSKEITSTAPQPRALVAGGVANSQFDQYYNSIGQGTIVKSATNLQPNESFTVKGVYADSRWKLYGREIGIGVGIFILVLVVSFGLSFLVFKKVFGKKNAPSNQPSLSKSNSFIIVLVASLGSAILIFLYTIGLYVLSFFANTLSFSYNFFSPLFLLLLAVISLCIYTVLLFTPTIIIGIKRGIMLASVTLALTLFWLIFFGIIFVGIFFLFFQDRQNPPYYPPIAPMGVESVKNATQGMGGMTGQ